MEATSKNILRKKYKKLRAELTDSDIEELSIKIANNLVSLQIWDKEFYHLFLSIKKQKEVETEFILNILLGKDKNVVISKSNFSDLAMEHFLLTDTTKIRINNHGIPEPVDGISIDVHKLDVVFIPLLAFDSIGNRIGYGKGFYDIFLKKCNPDVIKIGVSFFEAEEKISDVSVDDIPLNFCVTPTKIYNFNT